LKHAQTQHQQGRNTKQKGIEYQRNTQERTILTDKVSLLHLSAKPCQQLPDTTLARIDYLPANVRLMPKNGTHNV